MKAENCQLDDDDGGSEKICNVEGAEIFLTSTDNDHSLVGCVHDDACENKSTADSNASQVNFTIQTTGFDGGQNVFNAAGNIECDCESKSHCCDSTGNSDCLRSNGVENAEWPVPWSNKIYTGRCDRLLHNEIMNFYRYIMPTKEELVLRYNIFFRVKKCLSQLFPDLQMVLFGSLASDMLLPTSDIDILIKGVTFSYELFYAIAEYLKSSEIARDLQIISCTRVPVIKFSDSLSHIQIDITLDHQSGVVNTELVREFASFFSPMRPLVLLLKYMLQCRGMNIPFYGGLGSYALSLMVIFFLQTHHKTDKKTGKTEHNLGTLLCDFFMMYGFCFNYEDLGISVKDSGMYYTKEEKMWLDKFQPFLLSIEDPNDETNDVGRPVTNIMYIRSIFIDAYYKLTTTPAFECTLLSRIVQVSPQLLEHREICKKITHKLYMMNDKELFKSIEQYTGKPLKKLFSLPENRKYWNVKEKRQLKYQKNNRYSNGTIRV